MLLRNNLIALDLENTKQTPTRIHTRTHTNTPKYTRENLQPLRVGVARIIYNPPTGRSEVATTPGVRCSLSTFRFASTRNRFYKLSNTSFVNIFRYSAAFRAIQSVAHRKDMLPDSQELLGLHFSAQVEPPSTAIELLTTQQLHDRRGEFKFRQKVNASLPHTLHCTLSCLFFFVLLSFPPMAIGFSRAAVLPLADGLKINEPLNRRSLVACWTHPGSVSIVQFSPKPRRTERGEKCSK